MSISGIFEIGKSALSTAQKALTVTGNNIANVQTPGYTRQEVVQTELRPLDGRPGQIGTGVQITEIRRSVDRFVESSLLASREQLGRFGASSINPAPCCMWKLAAIYNDCPTPAIPQMFSVGRTLEGLRKGPIPTT